MAENCYKSIAADARKKEKEWALVPIGHYPVMVVSLACSRATAGKLAKKWVKKCKLVYLSCNRVKGNSDHILVIVLPTNKEIRTGVPVFANKFASLCKMLADEDATATASVISAQPFDSAIRVLVYVNVYIFLHMKSVAGGVLGTTDQISEVMETEGWADLKDEVKFGKIFTNKETEIVEKSLIIDFRKPEKAIREYLA